MGGGIFNGDVTERILNESPSFLKIANNSEGGRGVYYIDQSYTYGKLSELISSIKGDIVVQRPITQSPSIARLNPSSVNTIRCLTLLRKDGTAKLYSSCLRIGIGDTKVDNASSGGCVVGINEDGYLKEYAYELNGKRFRVHPASNIEFSTVRVPNFNKVKEFVIKMALRMSYFRLVSWDIALDANDDPILIEANLCSGGLNTHQLGNGPVFGDDTEEILKEVFHKR